MNCCNHCRDAGKFFNDRTARKELRRYKKKGPNKSTRLLLDELRKHDLPGKSLLDIGGGIGAISFELFEEGIDRAIHIDASKAYLEVTKAEAKRRKLSDRINHLFGDFTERSNEIEPCDIVTLDRVICCYPDMEKLVRHSAEKAMQYYGAVFPRNKWFVGWGTRAVNLYFKLRGSDFRTYPHPPEKIDLSLQNNGFHKISQNNTFLWDVVIYKRKD